MYQKILACHKICKEELRYSNSSQKLPLAHVLTFCLPFVLQLEFSDLDSGKLAVSKNDAWGLLYFGENYTISLAERYNLGGSITDDVLESGLVEAWTDKSSKYPLQIVTNGVRTNQI